jgi:hypothetical protein
MPLSETKAWWPGRETAAYECHRRRALSCLVCGITRSRLRNPVAPSRHDDLNMTIYAITRRSIGNVADGVRDAEFAADLIVKRYKAFDILREVRPPSCDFGKPLQMFACMLFVHAETHKMERGIGPTDGSQDALECSGIPVDVGLTVIYAVGIKQKRLSCPALFAALAKPNRGPCRSLYRPPLRAALFL